MIKILIVDDHPAVQEGLKAALSKLDDTEIVGVASDGCEAVLKAQALHPQLVIMDIALPNLTGIEATLQIKKTNPNVKVLIHTMHSYKQYLVDLMKAGISAYVLKQNPLSDLYIAIEVVKRGGTYLSEDMSAFWMNHQYKCGNGRAVSDPYDLLSPREREVFELLASGESIAKAAELLSVSKKTIETHKYRIMEKLQIRSVVKLTQEAVRRGIIEA